MFIIFRNDAEYFEYMVDCNGKICHKEIQNYLLYKLCNIHRSVKLNKICNMPFKNVWYNYYLDYDLIDKNDKNIFIFFEGNQMAYDRNFIIFLKKRFINSKFVFRYTNTICYLNSWTVDYINQMFDLVVTIDWKESKRRNWMYFPNTYNLRLVDNKRNVKIKYDLFFVGRDKGRLNQLVTLYDILSKKGIRCLFLINGVEKKDRICCLEGIKNIKIVSYQDIVKYIAESRCILEILQDNQYGSSLRPMEAIAYGKKLLTTDKEIINCSYYDDRYMRVIKDFNNIDFNFIKEDERIIYKNSSEISSEKLFDEILKFFIM